MKSSIIIGILSIVLTLLSTFETSPQLTPKSNVSDILLELDDSPSPHLPYLEKKGVSVDKGRALVLEGITVGLNGKKTTKQSKHFVCTSCHNIQKEDPDLAISDPQARLEYVYHNNLPFLPGTTLYGVVNRSSFYNGDYDKKYGELVVAARNNLREAIQLCAIECSQGRRLTTWELESVLAYLWTLELKIEDLNLSEPEKRYIEEALQNTEKQDSAISIIKSKYLAGSPATFIPPPDDRSRGYDMAKNPDNGQLVYDLSCKHCHENKRYSFFNLDDTQLTFDFLEEHISTYSRYSIYQVVRWGTQPINGKRAYMPHYTQERMSKQQLEDLRAYIQLKVK